MILRELHNAKENLKKIVEKLDFVELQEIPRCKFYHYESGACEEYCQCPEIDRTKNTKDFDSKTECWQCYLREVKKE